MMGKAFDRAAVELLDKGQPDLLVREIIAKKIIAIAKTGERDPDKLFSLALQELGFDP